MDFVSQDYWNNAYDHFNYFIADDEVTQWISRNFPYKPSNETFFEMGCYPGRYMAYFGKKGWTVSGMDLTPRIDEDFTSWLHSENIKTGYIKKGDVLAYAKEAPEQYDLVCSFGFIEHFENFLELITLHDSLLKKEGHLIISTPNFRGAVQKFLHSNLDKENLGRHYLPSMRPDLWKKQLEQLGYTISFCGYFGNFDFWYDEQERNKLQKTAVKMIRKIKPLLSWLPNSGLYSPYCGIIARKNK